jgi:uncharacterized protein GlcG (DUF336 family)
VASASSVPRVQGLPGITAVDGGLPILIDDRVVRAIGAAANQDAEVATAGLAAATAK